MDFKSKPCVLCGKASTFRVDEAKYWRWRTGELIQNVWPEMNAGQRELLVTGTHSECWDKLFAE